MTPGTRLAAGITLTLTTLMPLTALAITPTVDPEEPVVETPTDPVVENPDPDPEDEVLKRKAEDRLTKEKENPVKEKPKKVVKVPVGDPSTMIYPVPAKANFCPAGLQPVTISGVISCGSPNKAITYQQMLAHPKPVRAKRKKHVTYHRSAVPDCGVGTKGCVDR